MSAPATPQDIANVCKLLERLRTGEMNLIPSVARLGERKDDAGTAMLQRVETVLSAHLRRMQAPAGDGGPAFPFPSVSQNQATGETVVTQGDGGMPLRDYFASHVSAPGDLSGLWAKALNGREAPSWQADPVGSMRYWIEAEARYRYELADAMLKARSA